MDATRDFYSLYVESKIWQNEPIYKTGTDSEIEGTDSWLPGGKGDEGGALGV